MAVFTIERALQPQGGGVSQLFIIFADQVDVPVMDAFCQLIAKTFPTAGIVVAEPSQQMRNVSALVAKQALSDDELRDFVQQHIEDIQGFIQAFQQHLQIDAVATALVGIGQIGSLVMELTKREQPLAGRVIGFGTRYAELPQAPLSLEQTIHLLHAGQDAVVPVSHLAIAKEAVTACLGDITMDVMHTAQDSFNQELMQQMIQRLLTCVPLRYWKEAQQAAGEESAPLDETESTVLH